MHWVRGEKLGESHATIYKALTYPQSGDATHIPHVIAVKTAKASEFESLSKEKELLNKFKNCSSIIRCYGDEFSTENSSHNILYNVFFEYASGGCLSDRIIKNKGIPENLVKKYTRSILVALSHIHQQGYVHRDVKPTNILLVNEDNGEVAKLADFGIAKRITEKDEDDEFHGTLMYSAPEAIFRSGYVPKSDIWSLGCTVLHMLTGKTPWDININCDEDWERFSEQIIVGETPKISDKLSKDATDFLKKCLAHNPSSRFSADEFLMHHPFVKKSIKTGLSGHHHRLSSRLHSIVPHCFHMPRVVHVA